MEACRDDPDAAPIWDGYGLVYGRRANATPNGQDGMVQIVTSRASWNSEQLGWGLWQCLMTVKNLVHCWGAVHDAASCCLLVAAACGLCLRPLRDQHGSTKALCLLLPLGPGDFHL